jgi:hypothetical protein
MVKNEPEELAEFMRVVYTIGGVMLFPGSVIDRKMPVNGARGLHPRIKDRFDLTVECGAKCARSWSESGRPCPGHTVVVEGLRSNGTWGIDLMTPLSDMFGDLFDAAGQKARLYSQVVPVVEALTGWTWEEG